VRLRTPITAIRAASEILHDDDDIPKLKSSFCKTSFRSPIVLNRLIDKILDLENLKLENKKIYLSKTTVKTVKHLRILKSIN
jgi:K+-sensing histidine kinase KdpD